jgi:hypothetical protein
MNLSNTCTDILINEIMKKPPFVQEMLINETYQSIKNKLNLENIDIFKKVLPDILDELLLEQLNGVPAVDFFKIYPTIKPMVLTSLIETAEAILLNIDDYLITPYINSSLIETEESDEYDSF